MGLQNAKEARGPRHATICNSSSAAGRPATSVFGTTNYAAGGQGVAMRTTGKRENILQQNAHYRDFTSPSTLKRESSVGVQRREALCAQNSATTETKKYPVVLRYANTDAKLLAAKKEGLFVAVESLGWRQLPMTASEDSFYVVVDLVPGEHHYRFVQNGSEFVDLTQPTTTFPPTEEGEASGDGVHVTEGAANVIQVNEALLTTKEDEEIPDDGQGWGFEETKFSEDRRYPPIMPVHLRYTPLNTPPTAMRCTRDGVVCAVSEETVSPENLPLPLSGTVNHLYFQRREDHVVAGLTTRYCNKYVTVVYYSSTDTVGT
ncbi:putative Glycogen recognition site of AMP activated protein [Trypanosoma vivax]|uniref:Association with the SNF1 complex (ASC) domain-containing protein n=1 Tax=Trypanosoma vivax (strain Y486) TaxID=1055687 RepID=G0U0I3_TRYVY|nr:hypothetical protein TRVL_07016 [Trypanosoma vivax]KAH8611052.1 putative Glycogen recognition site of AMP activated protein [Trypanosoma vivax]CCC49582.1 conserved hypothetical protein [Trypanosoma vivax Y486]